MPLVLAATAANAVPGWILGAACAAFTVWMLVMHPPTKWGERMERDSPGGYYTVSRGRAVVFLILGGYLGLFLLWDFANLIAKWVS